MGHGGCRCFLQGALLKRCLCGVSGSGHYLQPRKEGWGLGWARGCAGGSMGRVAVRGVLATHLGHRPGTMLKGPRGAVAARTTVALRGLATKRQRPRDKPRCLRPEVGAPPVGRKGSHSRGRAACCGARPGAPGASPDQAAVWKFWGEGQIPLSWQWLSHRDAPAGLGDCSILTGLPGPWSLASSASKIGSGRT